MLFDKVMKVKEVTPQSLPMLISAWRISCLNTEKVKEHVRTALFANSKLTCTLIEQREENLNQQIQQFQQPQNFFPYLQSVQIMIFKALLACTEKIQDRQQKIQQFEQQRPLNLFTSFRLSMHEFDQKDLQRCQIFQQKMQKHEQLLQNQIENHKTKEPKPCFPAALSIFFLSSSYL